MGRAWFGLQKVGLVCVHFVLLRVAFKRACMCKSAYTTALPPPPHRPCLLPASSLLPPCPPPPAATHPRRWRVESGWRCLATSAACWRSSGRRSRWGRAPPHRAQVRQHTDRCQGAKRVGSFDCMQECAVVVVVANCLALQPPPSTSDRHRGQVGSPPLPLPLSLPTPRWRPCAGAGDGQGASVKYLSSSRLMGLQLRDATFRRHFLLQCLILMQASHACAAALPAACWLADLPAWLPACLHGGLPACLLSCLPHASNIQPMPRHSLVAGTAVLCAVVRAAEEEGPLLPAGEAAERHAGGCWPAWLVGLAGRVGQWVGLNG